MTDQGKKYLSDILQAIIKIHLYPLKEEVIYKLEKS